MRTDDDNNDSESPNKGTVIIDETCTPADTTFPQDLNLLNKSRENLEKIIDNSYGPANGKKPRTYRKMARKNFLNTLK